LVGLLPRGEGGEVALLGTAGSGFCLLHLERARLLLGAADPAYVAADLNPVELALLVAERFGASGAPAGEPATLVQLGPLGNAS
jgi:hypothetical protein